MMVFIRERTKAGHRPRFHRTDDCPRLTQRPPKGEQHRLMQLDLRDVTATPCLTCFPDAPRVKVVKQFCKICNHTQPYPCKHNGGVPVQTIHRTKRGDVAKTYYVWPHLLPFALSTS